MINREDELNEIIRRSEETRKRRSRIRAACLGAGTAAACLLLLVLGVGGTDATGVWTKDNYGAFILSPQSGGYVLTAVIAFILGAALITAIVIYRRRSDRSSGNREDRGRQNENEQLTTQSEKRNNEV